MTLPYNAALKTYLTALAQAATMLQRDRRLAPTSRWCARLVAAWPKLELASDGEFTAFAELFYRNACYAPFAQPTRPEEPVTAERRLARNIADLDFLARNSRQFTFLCSVDAAHAGIGYQVAAVCFSPRGEKHFVASVVRHKALLEAGVDALRAAEYDVREARLLVVLAGRLTGQIKTETLSVRATTRFPASVVSLELWDADDLQYDATHSALYTPHRPLDALSAEELARVPARQLRIAAREPLRLPRLTRDDPIVRRFDFCARQVVLVERRNLHEGGVTHVLRLVDK